MRRNINQLEGRKQTEVLRMIRLRAALMLFFFAFIFVALYGRSYELQLGKDPRLARLASRQYHKKIVLAPERGTIFDRNGHELAVDIQVYSIFTHPHLVDRALAPKIAEELGRVLGTPPKDILEKLTSDKRFVWIARRVSKEVRDVVETEKFTGVHWVPEKKRYYPHGTLAGQLLGAVGYDAQALGGLELSYDSDLKSPTENYLFEKDAKGRSYVYMEAAQQEFADVHLSIDRTIQYIAERELEKTREHFQFNHGFVIVTRPKTGEILAVANSPSFDPNRYGEYPMSGWRNWAFLDVFEPGSTFKSVTAAAALKTGTISLDDKFFCESGHYTVGKKVIKDHHPYGSLSVLQILQVSSNIGVTKIQQKIGKETLYQMIAAFGFGKRSLLNVPGESPGLLMSVKNWGSVESANIAFGQGIAVTGLQMVGAYGAMGNGGKLMHPILASRVVTRDGKTRRKQPIETVREVLPASVSRDLTTALKTVVEPGGTATRAALEYFDVAGKTGTAQKVEDGVYVKGKYVASFIGYVPAGDPELLIYAVVDEPRPQYYGGLVAAPIFQRVADQALYQLGVAGSQGKAERKIALEEKVASPSVGASSLQAAARVEGEASGEESPLIEVEAALSKGEVPNLRGISLRELLRVFNRSPYRLESQGVGFVVQQSPAPGAPLSDGSVVRVALKTP